MAGWATVEVAINLFPPGKTDYWADLDLILNSGTV
jgi:hypothetical protein